MADKEISDLTAASTLDGTELAHVVQSGDSRKTTLADMLAVAHSQAWSGVTGTPTTLSGYGITDAQAKNSNLTTIAGLTPSSAGFMVGNGSVWTVESGSTARASLGLAIGTNVQAYNAGLADIAGLAKTDGAVIIGDGTNFVLESGATLRTSLGLSIGTNVQAYNATLNSLAGISLASGDILYGTGANALARLAKGTDGQVLMLDSGLPKWQTTSGTGDMIAAVYDPNGTGADAFDQDNMADGTTNKNYTATEQTKLAGIEALADVTDATNVAAAGAVMEADTTTASMSFVLDEDDFTSNSATKLPTQQSVAANIDRRAPKARFKTPADLIADTTIGYSGKTFTVTGAAAPGGEEILAGDFRYRAAVTGASDHHTVIPGTSLKVYAQPLPYGGYDARQLGLIADGSSHALSTRYSTLADAQAAFPLLNAAGRLTALTDEIDWACAEETIRRCQGTAGLPTANLGANGVAMINRQILADGSNKGIVITGPADTSYYQGSTRTGLTLKYTGNPGTTETMLHVGGTYTRLERLGFVNAGNADSAFLITGATGTTGAGSNYIRDISIVEASGTSPWGVAAMQIYNGIDYTEWNNITYSGTSPVVLDFDGGSRTNGGTTRFKMQNGLFTQVSTAGTTLVKVKNGNIEQMAFEDITLNAANGSGGICFIDTTDIDSTSHGFDLDILTFRHIELDCNAATSGTEKLIGKLTNVNACHVQDCQWQDGAATTTRLFELTNSNIEIEHTVAIGINGPLVKCMDSTSKVKIGRGVRSITSGGGQGKGMVDSNLAGNVVVLTQGGQTLRGFNWDKEHQICTLSITTNAGENIQAADYTGTPPGEWIQGQKFTIIFTNNIGGGTAWTGGVGWNANIDGPAVTSLADTKRRAYTFVWTGSIFLCIGVGPDH